MPKSKNQKENILLTSAIVMIILSLLITVAASVREAKLRDRTKSYADFSSGWMLENGEEADLNSLTSDCRIHKSISEVKDGQTLLFFNARNVNVNVYIEDEQVYQYRMSEDNFLKSFYGRTVGSDYVRVPIYERDKGKTIYIEVFNLYSNTRGCKITDMYYGDGVDIVRRNVTAWLGSFCFCIIVLFLGLVFIILYFPLARKKIVGKEMLYLGLAAFSTGVCMITDCKLFQIIIGHNMLYYTVSQLFMSLIPIPLFLFFAGLYDTFNKRIVNIIGVINVGTFFVSFLLNLFAVRDYHELALITLLVLVIDMIYIAAITIRDILHKRHNLIFHNIGAIMIALASLVDVTVSSSETTMDTSFFTRFGLAGFMCMECAQVLRNHIDNYEKGLHTQFVGNLAYHDGLTNLLNRTSFMEDMDQLEAEERADVLFAMFDINNLKYVNDNFGHTTGDEMIILICEAIDDFFNVMGKCYRIGGDEIVLIATGDNLEKRFISAQSKFIRHILQLDAKTEYPLSVAVGYALRRDSHERLKELLDEADAKMYENKKEMKKNIKLEIK